ncbi:MAG: GTP 3',8-cyclase MoaA [Bacteroidota bacterium]|nr:GTP 3',8-cyclase MoaA [Bacteroidota bacterium]
MGKNKRNMQSQLIDKYGRELNYLRLSVTDRCNLRCYYCMPEEGVAFVPKKDVLTWEEMYLLSFVFTTLGVTKIRITGGEPFVRKGLISFLQNIKKLDGLNELTITTNATLIEPYIDELKRLNIKQLNVSLDTLNAQRFHQITRRDNFANVYHTIYQLLDEGFQIKLNCVVSATKNVDDIIPFIELTKPYNLAVRFLEEMPFNGSSVFENGNLNYKDIYEHISRHYDDKIVALINPKNSTSLNYKIHNYAGTFGIIPAFSRTFCGTCNRIRLSATGELRTCLYAAPATNLRDALRNGATENELSYIIINAIANRAENGFEAEEKNAKQTHESMSVLGG